MYLQYDRFLSFRVIFHFHDYRRKGNFSSKFPGAGQIPGARQQNRRGKVLGGGFFWTAEKVLLKMIDINTLQGTNKTHQWERKFIFPTAFMGYVSSKEGKINVLPSRQEKNLNA